MRTNKKLSLTLISILTLLLISTMILVGCVNSGNMEKDMSIDTSTDYGLYWWGEGKDDFVRYTKNMDEKYFNPEKPTLLFFHGWSPGENENDDSKPVYYLATSAASINRAGVSSRDYMSEMKAKGYNVGAFYWARYSADLFSLFRKVWVEFKDGHSIACKFAKEYADCFKGYDKEVTFMGHSYGAQTSIATAYLIYNMADKGLIDKKSALPTRISLADPYIGDLAINSDMSVKECIIDNLQEPIASRIPANLVADCIEYLNEKDVVVDVYCGMPLAYDAFAQSASRKELRESIYTKLKNNTIWTVLEGMQKRFGETGDIHNITYDWVLMSFFTTISIGETNYPTAGLSNEQARKLVGNSYVTTFEGLNLKREGFIQQ